MQTHLDSITWQGGFKNIIECQTHHQPFDNHLRLCWGLRCICQLQALPPGQCGAQEAERLPRSSWGLQECVLSLQMPEPPEADALSGQEHLFKLLMLNVGKSSSRSQPTPRRGNENVPAESMKGRQVGDRLQSLQKASRNKFKHGSTFLFHGTSQDFKTLKGWSRRESHRLERLDDPLHVNQLAIICIEGEVHLDSPQRVDRHRASFDQLCRLSCTRASTNTYAVMPPHYLFLGLVR